MFAVLMYEELDGCMPLLGRCSFVDERQAEVFASRSIGTEATRPGGGVGVVSLATVWECDELGNIVRPIGDDFE